MQGFLKRIFSQELTEAELLRLKKAVIAIRMEAIGGQGANSAGKILAEAAVLGMGFTGNHFSSFGSEKRGSPVSSFVRISPQLQPVRSASFIKTPDFLLIFHESLMDKHPEIISGANENTEIILNSSKKPKSIVFPINTKFARLHVINATALAAKHKCGMNAIMLGALAGKLSLVDKQTLEATLSRFFLKLGEKVVSANLAGFQAGFNKVRTQGFRQSQCHGQVGGTYLPAMGYLNSPEGGLVINPGNTVLRDNSASRKGTAPQFLSEICFNCGFCDMVCPDFCFVWQKDEKGIEPAKLLGIDYQYCKGCQKCIEACPVEALVLVSEEKIPDEERQHKVYPGIQVDKRKLD